MKIKPEILIGVFVILLLAGLIPTSQWRGDEYFEIPRLHTGGLTHTISRVINWSPRPLSELFVYLYAKSVLVQRKPLIGGVIAISWTVLVAAVIVPAITAGTNLRVAVVLLCMFLLGHNIGEVFYWPFGAIAYLPTLGGIALLFMLDVVSLRNTPAGRVHSTIALVITATCSEVGAVFVVIYGVLAGVASIRDKDHDITGWLLPLLTSLTVLFMMSAGRVVSGHEVFEHTAAVHHPLASTVAAIPRFIWEMLGRTNSSQSVYIGFLTRAMFFLGVYFSVSCTDLGTTTHLQLLRLAMVIALIGSSFVMLSASYYQFGTACCERHETMRECYIALALGSLACFLAGFHPFKSEMLASACLSLAVLVPLWNTAPKISADYFRYGQFGSARSQTWTSGQRPGPSMVVTQVMPGRIVGGYTVPAKVYKVGNRNSALYPNWLLSFFGKQSGVFTEPLTSPEAQKK